MTEMPRNKSNSSDTVKVVPPLLSPIDRQCLLVDWNRTAAEYPKDQCVHWLFEAIVRKTPDAPAVEMDGVILTYRELNDRADGLAAHLRGLGVGPDVLVGHYTERSLDLVVGVLGILKAGGAYVPIDPAYPADRIAHILADAKAPAIVTQRKLVSHLPATVAKLVIMDEPLSATASAPIAEPVLTSDHLAYVIYTSGSTGKPKGVQIQHRALVNLLNSIRKRPGLRPDDVMLALTTISFDIAGIDLHLPLTTGAKIVVASRESVIDGSALIDLVERYRVTVLQATPATWRLMLESGWKGRAGLRILCTGEALPRDLAQKLLPCCAELWNMYGPTETTIWSTYDRVIDADVITIGRPIDNTDLYILDENLQPVAIGGEGELMIGGDGLAVGYNGLPVLTAEKFIPHPFKPGQRLYRTGDLARYRPDGRVDCLGRIDFQVKIRGYRIELGEIESVLSKHPAVSQAVVTAWEDALGEKRLVAYLVPNGSTEPSVDELRQILRAALPEYMIPAVFTILPRMPLTPNGKIDRKALPVPVQTTPVPRASGAPLRGELERIIAGVWREFLSVQHVGAQDNFFDLGGHSLILGRIHARLRKVLQRDLTIVELFQHPTIQSLADHLMADRKDSPQGRPRAGHTASAGESVAIVGMAGRFPGANNLAEFWRNLRGGIESISVLSSTDLTAAGVPAVLADNPLYVRARAILANAEDFDAHLFGYSPREATITDPQQRVFLEVAWEALENAGYDPEQYPSPIGVYAGGSPNVYVFHLMAKLGAAAGGYGFPLTVSNEKDYLSTRVSYELNLKGPSVTIQTACSTSLVAVHMACRSLLGGECTIALAGAVNVNVPQQTGYLYQEGGIVSPDGHCRVFDAAAGGTVFGNGLGIVVLKRLSEAMADGDTIHAVIKGTAINNDGSSKVGFTAPSVDGQAEVIAMAHAAAGLTADSISYVEAHGTGTALGDPIEIAGLTQAFRASTDRSGFCALGSVKTNIGHLDSAAGIAGLLKTVLALQHRELPPTLLFSQPNPKIDFANSPFHVNAALSPWVSSGAPRRAGVSCFGVGGTNSHAVLEEAPAPVPSDPPRPQELLVFSAKTKTALAQLVKNFAEHMAALPSLHLGDAAFTLQVGRRALEHRCALVGENREQVLRSLETKEGLIQTTGVAGRPQVVFMFSGQGAQYTGMAAELYRTEPFFARTIDECLELAKPYLSVDLRAVLFGGAISGSADINQTALAQPALFIVEYSMARLWMSWGITPESMIGHSIGEYAAACLAGVFSLKDAVELVAARGRLMQQLPAGSMLAVPLAETAVVAMLKAADPAGRISLAALNAPGSCVLSGPTEALDKLEADLATQGTATRKLHTSHAFHSSMMDPALDEFTAIVARVKLSPPRLPYVSNLTGTWIRPEEATDPGYYARHLRQAVRFSAGIQELGREPDRVFLEVGPGQTLTTLARRHTQNGRPPLALPSLRPVNDTQSDVAFLLNTVGRLWLSGAHIAWAGFTRGVARRRIPLPTYPFERQRYMVDMVPVVTGAGEEIPAVQIAHARPEVQTEYVAPQTEREAIIAQIWQRCLGIDHVGLNDNFFELGGDSLLAGQVVAAIEKELKIDLEMILFFAAPTIATLVPLLDPAVVEPKPVAPPDRREVRRDLAGERLRRQQARSTKES